MRYTTILLVGIIILNVLIVTSMDNPIEETTIDTTENYMPSSISTETNVNETYTAIIRPDYSRTK